MRKYRVTIDGKTPLLMHADNIAWADEMAAWKNDPKNQAASKAGDDRTPPFRWLGSLYHDEQRVALPSENVMRALMSGGALVPTGKGQKTFKAQTQSGMLAPDPFWPLLVNGQPIPTAELFADMQTRTWEAYNALAKKLGFLLYLKRAKIGQSKHIRVRPRFDHWTTAGVLVVTDAAIKTETLEQIGALAGQYVGLGDWRPGGKTPGPHGMFAFTVQAA